MVGFSCCIAWVSILKYLEFRQNVYLITFLLKYSLPSLLKFMVKYSILIVLVGRTTLLCGILDTGVVLIL